MGRRKKKKSNLKETEQEESYTALKVLCVMSFIGFIISMLVDTGNYISFSSIEEMKMASNQLPYEQIETQLEEWNEIGVDVSKKGLDRIATMYAIRTLIDVLAMVGVVFMFYRIRVGYYIYVLFQFLYVIVPFLFFGSLALFVVPYSSVAITLIYVALFTSQQKKLTR